jgi:hypothetical protein
MKDVIEITALSVGCFSTRAASAVPVTQQATEKTLLLCSLSDDESDAIYETKRNGTNKDFLFRYFV